MAHLLCLAPCLLELTGLARRAAGSRTPCPRGRSLGGPCALRWASFIAWLENNSHVVCPPAFRGPPSRTPTALQRPTWMNPQP